MLRVKYFSNSAFSHGITSVIFFFSNQTVFISEHFISETVDRAKKPGLRES